MIKYSATRKAARRNMTNRSILLSRRERSQVNSPVMGTWGCDVITQYPSLMMNREFFSAPPPSIIKRAHLVFFRDARSIRKQHVHFAITRASCKSIRLMRGSDLISTLAPWQPPRPSWEVYCRNDRGFSCNPPHLYKWCSVVWQYT